MQGFVKRKGIEELSSQLAHILNDSPSRRSMNIIREKNITEIKRDEGGRKDSPSKLAGLGAYASAAKLGRNGRMQKSLDFGRNSGRISPRAKMSMDSNLMGHNIDSV